MLGLELICRCDRAFPANLQALEAPPAVLHIAGGADRFRSLAERDPVAVVGARRANDYGIGVARGLGRGLGSARVTVVSGMASEIDTAAHEGAIERAGRHRGYSAGPGSSASTSIANSGIHRQIVSSGVAVSEMPPGVSVRKWMFVARNRLIAGLCELTVVVQAAAGSGSLHGQRGRHRTRAGRSVRSPDRSPVACQRGPTSCCVTVPSA